MAKGSQVYIRSMAIKTTENVRLGFFKGKASRITNIAKTHELVVSKISRIIKTEVPPFQLIYYILGPKEPTMQSKAVMVECSCQDAGILCPALENIFSPKSKHPFILFQVFYHLSDQAKLRYYREHKIWTEDDQIVEISFPSNFQDLDTEVTVGEVSSLREFLFDYTPPVDAKNFVFDVDNASRSGDTVMLVHIHHKELLKQVIFAWVLNNLHIKLEWGSELSSKTFWLSDKTRQQASKYESAVELFLDDKHFPHFRLLPNHITSLPMPGLISNLALSQSLIPALKDLISHLSSILWDQ